MYNPPFYVWVTLLVGPLGFLVMTSVVLYGGAVRAGLPRRKATSLAGGTAVVLSGWFGISTVIAGDGGYDSTSGVPWLPIATSAALVLFLALSRTPAVMRALTAPGMASRLVLPQSVRVTGVTPLLYMALGHLPALFALPAALGDMATGMAAPVVARRLARGAGPREALWFNGFGIADLVVSMILGGLTGYRVLNVTPTAASLSQLPLALVPTAVVPMLLALHIISIRTLTTTANTPLLAFTAPWRESRLPARRWP